MTILLHTSVADDNSWTKFRKTKVGWHMYLSMSNGVGVAFSGSNATFRKRSVVCATKQDGDKYGTGFPHIARED